MWRPHLVRVIGFVASTQGTALLEKPVFYGRPILRRGTHRLHRLQIWYLYEVIPIGSMYGIYANIGGILMVNVTIYSIHGSYGIVKYCKHDHISFRHLFLHV